MNWWPFSVDPRPDQNDFGSISSLKHSDWAVLKWTYWAKEQEQKAVSVRHRDLQDLGVFPLNDAVDQIAVEAKQCLLVPEEWTAWPMWAKAIQAKGVLIEVRAA